MRPITPPWSAERRARHAEKTQKKLAAYRAQGGSNAFVAQRLEQAAERAWSMAHATFSLEKEFAE